MVRARCGALMLTFCGLVRSVAVARSATAQAAAAVVRVTKAGNGSGSIYFTRNDAAGYSPLSVDGAIQGVAVFQSELTSGNVSALYQAGKRGVLYRHSARQAVTRVATR